MTELKTHYCKSCEKLKELLIKQEQSFNARDANRATANVNLAKLLEAEQKKNNLSFRAGRCTSGARS